jgi:hypothetical protein
MIDPTSRRADINEPSESDLLDMVAHSVLEWVKELHKHRSKLTTDQYRDLSDALGLINDILEGSM